VDVERHLISKVIQDRNLGPVAEAGIRAEFFLEPKNRAVFQTILEHKATYGEVPSLDVITADYPTYAFLTPTDSIEYLIQQVRKRHTGALLEQGLSAAVDAYDAGSYADAQQMLSQMLLRIATDVPTTEDVDLTEQGMERHLRYEALRHIETGLLGIPSGFDSIDRATQGFQGGQLVTFVGPPKAGKSTLVALAARSAHVFGVTPLVVSFEMTNDETAARIDAFAAQVSHRGLLTGQLSGEEMDRVGRALRRMDSMHPFWLSSDAHNLTTLTAVQAKIEALKPDIVFVDGVYMMQDEQGEAQGSPQALTNITRGFKRMAMHLGIPIIISTQALEWKIDKKRGLTSASIGYSSSFSQDSDVVLGVERTEEASIQKVKVILSRNCPPMEAFIEWNWEKGTFQEVEEHALFADFANVPADF
jgi:replicative DNA helicase